MNPECRDDERPATVEHDDVQEGSWPSVVIRAEHLNLLFEALRERGYTVVGPTIGQDAIVYDELPGASALPAGWTDEQAPGSYRLKRRDDSALFGYAVGPHSWKRFLFPPTTPLFSASHDGRAMLTEDPEPPAPRYAFIGVRACELAAIDVQDRVFVGGSTQDPVYSARRDGAFLVAVNCAEAGGTCFCVSMDTGPKATQGFDLALTELLSEDEHEFLVEVGSDRGADVIADLPQTPAREEHVVTADRIVERTAASMGREMDTEGIKDLLYRNLEHPRWDDVAARCLACGNCTLACPTCFCSSVEDASDLAGEEAGRQRVWDSCFTLDHSYLHGGSVRVSTRSRYRQWMTHKLATWIDQFGTSGCVGCGRCITWCPVGIDITEEVAAIRAADRGDREGASVGDA
jgi:formate hydrogenlyase subunit 6/NADH:ubiquinone oxidoreductase subunit I